VVAEEEAVVAPVPALVQGALAPVPVAAGDLLNK